MPEGYLHLTCEQRCQIYALLQSGHSQAHIARQIGVDPSTISRELVRNTGARGYRFKQAHEKASQRRQEASDKPRKMTPDLVELIEEKLTQEQWSPDQISGRLAKDGVAFISHERIYQHVWKDKKDGGTLYLHLRHSLASQRQKIQQAQGQEFGARADSEPRRILSPQKAASETGRPTRLSAPITKALSCRTSSEPPNTPSSPNCRTRTRTLSCRPAHACSCRSLTKSKQSLTTMEKSSPLTPKSQPRWGHYPILPSPITRGNAASTNTLCLSGCHPQPLAVVWPCSWTFTSVAIFGSHNRCQSSSDFSLTMRPVPATWRRLAGATGSFAPIVRRRESRSASQIVLASCAAAGAAVIRR